MKILMLILASDDTEIYLRLQDMWRSYMKSNPSVDCYFYKGDPHMKDAYKLTDDTLYIQIHDLFETVYEKTLRAFRYFEKELYKYDFVYRTNVSSFVVLNKYVDYCTRIPRERFVSAVIGVHGLISFPSGSGFTITPDLIRQLIADNPPLTEQDDVTIGEWLTEKHIVITPVPRFDFVYNCFQCYVHNHTLMSVDSIFHYRIKNTNRALDIEIHRTLLKHHYGK